MSKTNKKIAIGVLAILHQIMFWRESMGVNMVIFSVMAISVNLFMSEEIQWYKFRYFIMMHLIACAALLYNGSSLAIVSVWISTALTIVYIQNKEFKSIAFMIIGFFERFIIWMAALGKLFSKREVVHSNSLKTSHNLLFSSKLVVVPILVFAFFFIIFNIANPIFHHYTLLGYEFVGNSIEDFFTYFSMERIILLIFGIILARFILFKATKLKSVLKESQFQIVKNRVRVKVGKFKLMALITEYKVGVILVGMVNVLLLVVNIIDINWLWFGFDPKSVGNLSQLVHEGTYMLIFSILLSMGIIEYFFRGNINFYGKNTALKVLCYVWIFQNIILIVSVAMRNYHYIHEMGLAHKRIGVVFFLCLTLCGLISQLFKISKRYSGYYLWKVNSFALWVIITLGSVFNWDLIIAEYNLKYTMKNLDKGFLLTLSDGTLGLLQENKSLFNDQQYASETYIVTVKDYLHSRVVDFKERYEEESWMSWNYSDYKAYEQLQQ